MLKVRIRPLINLWGLTLNDGFDKVLEEPDQKGQSMTLEFQSMTEVMRTPTIVTSESGTNKNSAAPGGCTGIGSKNLKTFFKSKGWNHRSNFVT